MQVNRPEVRAIEVPVRLLRHEGKINQIHERGLERFAHLGSAARCACHFEKTSCFWANNSTLELHLCLCPLKNKLKALARCRTKMMSAGATVEEGHEEAEETFCPAGIASRHG